MWSINFVHALTTYHSITYLHKYAHEIAGHMFVEGSMQRPSEELLVPIGGGSFPQGQEELVKTAERYVLQEETHWSTVGGCPKQRDEMRMRASLFMIVIIIRIT